MVVNKMPCHRNSHVVQFARTPFAREVNVKVDFFIHLNETKYKNVKKTVPKAGMQL